MENPSFEDAIGGGGVPDGIRVLLGSDVQAALFSDPRDSVDGLHSLRMHNPSGPDGLTCLVYGGGGDHDLNFRSQQEGFGAKG